MAHFLFSFTICHHLSSSGADRWRSGWGPCTGGNKTVRGHMGAARRGCSGMDNWSFAGGWGGTPTQARAWTDLLSILPPCDDCRHLQSLHLCRIFVNAAKGPKVPGMPRVPVGSYARSRDTELPSVTVDFKQDIHGEKEKEITHSASLFQGVWSLDKVWRHLEQQLGAVPVLNEMKVWLLLVRAFCLGSSTHHDRDSTSNTQLSMLIAAVTDADAEVTQNCDCSASPCWSKGAQTVPSDRPRGPAIGSGVHIEGKSEM